MFNKIKNSSKGEKIMLAFAAFMFGASIAVFVQVNATLYG